jgi:lipopolysaccharide export LptBFGC system permease protein LptF
VKFKTTLSTPQPSIEHPSTSNNQDELVSTTGNRRGRGTSSDYATEVTLFNSKSDSWALNLNDETTQTGSISGGGLLFNGACTDAERQQRQNTSTQDNETTDLLSKFQQGITSNHFQHPPLKPTTSNLVTAAENPWKKLSNVRYKLDGHDANQRNSTNYHHVRAQHITFV